MNVTEQIKGYFDRIEDIPYLENILGSVPLPDLLQSLLDLLNSSVHDDVAKADLFIRDVIYQTKGHNEAFTSNLAQAGLPTCYEQNVFRPNFWIRQTAIGTLRTFIDWWSPDGLTKALEFLEANDPTFLPAAIGVQMHRSQWKDWFMPNRLIRHQDFLVRWSVLGLLSERCIHFPLPNPMIVSAAKTCLTELHQDENIAVKTEANFLTATLSFYEIMPSLEKLEKRRRSKEMNAVVPKFRFADLRLQVGNQLSAEQKNNFTLEELRRFVRNSFTPQ
jgi:hypothetical protein